VSSPESLSFFPPPTNAAQLTLLLTRRLGTLTLSPRGHGGTCSITATAASTDDIRADACVINLTGRQYIDVAVTNPAAITYRPKPVPNASDVLLPAPPGSSAAIEMRTADKMHRYHPVLGDDVNVFMRFVAFVVEATGRLSSDALRLVKLACAESKNPLMLHDFVTQVGGAIARYNAMAAQAWVHHCLHLSANLAVGGG